MVWRKQSEVHQMESQFLHCIAKAKMETFCFIVVDTYDPSGVFSVTRRAVVARLTTQVV